MLFVEPPRFVIPTGMASTSSIVPGLTEATTAVVAIQLGGVCGSFMAGVTWEGLRLNSLGAEKSEELD